MSDKFTTWTVRIVLAGLFFISVVHFGKFVYTETWPVIRPLFFEKTPTPQNSTHNN